MRNAGAFIMDGVICTGYRPRVRGRNAVLVALVGVISCSGLVAQSTARPVARTEVYAGSEFETYLRNLQVLGIVKLYPWSARRFTAIEVDRLLPADSAHPWAARYDWRPAAAGGISVALTRPEVASRVNTTFPFGYNDGAVWAGRGITLSAQGGLSVRYGPLAAALVPLVSWASNSRFRLQPNGRTGALRYEDGRYPGTIDLPQRFGDHPYALASGGQTVVEVSQWGLTAGVSAANDYWGPASDFPVILGNNAAGFPHFFAGTAVPLDLWIARVHVRTLFGRLTQSAYAPLTGDTAIRAAAGAVLVLTPRWPAGLEFGATHFIHRVWARRGSLLHELGSPFGLNTLNNDPLENHLISVFFRWVIPRGGVEVYGEYGTEDYRYDLREIFVEPDHDGGYTIGLRQVARRPNGSLRVIRAEVQNLQRGILVESRGQSPFYIHSPLDQGHTYRGQILGSPWGFGGAAATIALDWYHPRGRWTVSWSRLLRGDTGDTVATVPQNPRSLDVLHTLGAEGLFFRGRYDILARVTAVYELNRDFRSDAFNLNLIVGARTSLR
jgi:capsule assembly protein Wzi